MINDRMTSYLLLSVGAIVPPVDGSRRAQRSSATGSNDIEGMKEAAARDEDAETKSPRDVPSLKSSLKGNTDLVMPPIMSHVMMKMERTDRCGLEQIQIILVSSAP